MERVNQRIEKGNEISQKSERELQSMQHNFNKMKKSNTEIHDFHMKKLNRRNKEAEDLHYQIDQEVTQRAKLEIKHGLQKGKLQELR